jgi:hypothetical protein
MEVWRQIRTRGCPSAGVTFPLYRVYGTSQEFISYDFYENVIRSAASKGYLDGDLTRENWESRMFQFYAGDLYEVLDKI